MSTVDKSHLRKALRGQRRQLSEARRQACGELAAECAPTLPGWSSAVRAGIYLDSDGEMPTEALARACRRCGQTLYLPVIAEGNTLFFARWPAASELWHNRFGIPEPGPEQPRCPVVELDLLFMPVVAWDRCGSRLGMGGGYFDRSLADLRGAGPLRVGLAYGFQEVGELPRDPWDMGLDYVLTEEGLVRTS